MKSFFQKCLLLNLITFFSIAVFGQTAFHCWDFNGTTPFSSPLNTDNRVLGDGEITHSFSDIQDFGGDAVQDCGDNNAGDAFSPRGTNGRSMLLAFPTTGYENINLSFRVQGTSTGFTNSLVEYSVDAGTNWNNAPSNFTISGSFETRTIDFSSISAANDNPDFQIRITLNGSSSGTGNNRYDNIKLNGDLIVACPSNDDFSTSNASGSYDAGSFTGISGVDWEYADARDEGSYQIDNEGIILRNASDSYIEGVISGGVGFFFFEYRKAFTGSSDRQLELLVDGTPVKTSPVFGGFSGADATVYTFFHPINTTNDITIKIKNVGSTSTSRHTVIDNISWTCPTGPYHWLPTSGSHDFTDASNWSPQRTTVLNNDILIFDNGGSSTASDVPSQTIGQMQVIGTDITFTPQAGGGLKTFTIAGVTGDDDFEMDASSVFTLDSQEDFDIEINSGATAVVHGVINMLSTGTAAYHGFIGSGAGATTFKNGASFTQGPKSNGNVFGSSGLNNTTVFESGSEFISVSGANPFAKAQPDSKVDFQAGSLYKHQQANEPSIVGRTYSNIEFDYNGNIGFATGSAGGDEFTCDDFTVTQGNVEFFYSLVALPLNLNIKGDITVAAGSNVYFVPDAASATSSVRINGSAAQSINGAGNFEIGQFGKLEIENDLTANTDVNVYGLLELKSGEFITNDKLTIASDANSTGVINDFTPGYTGTISGDVTVERYVSNVSNGFHFVGSSVSGAILSDWGGEFSIAATNGGSNNAQIIPTTDCSPTALDASSPYGGLFDYREDQVTDCRFEGWHVRTSGTIQDAQGFAGVIPNGMTIDLSGPANTGNISSYTLTRSASNNTPDHRGFNMLANPYPSPLEWTDVAAANTDIDGVAYLFQTSGSYNGTFQTINDITGGTIASSQAFQVEVLNVGNTTVDFTNSMRRTSGNNDFLRQSQSYDSRIILQLEGNGYADRTIVAYSDNFTAGYDRKYDAKKLKSNNGQPTLYTFSNPDIEKQSINAIANSDKYDVLPMGLLSGVSGTFTVTASELNVGAYEVVFLEDLQTGMVQNLNDNPDYTFTADVNDAAHRFNLHMMPAPERSSMAVACDLTLGSINVDFAEFTINGQSTTWDNAVLKDANGQIVDTKNNPINNWTVQNLAEGNYELILEMGTYSVSNIISVAAQAAVTADYSADKTIVEIGESINFTDLSTGALYYDWDMGDGNVLYNTQNPTHSYLNEGIYTVILNVSSDDCSDVMDKEVEVRQKTISSIADIDGKLYNIYSFSNNIVIEGSDLSNKSISVYNALGQKMDPNTIRFTNEKVELSMDMEATGMYFVELISDNGNERVTEQVFVNQN